LDTCQTLSFCPNPSLKSGDAPIASEALERIAKLYAIEKTIRGQNRQERQAVRQERSKPLVIALHAWLELQLSQVSGKAPTAEAIRYVLHHLDGLTRFLDDGRIELDTNAVECGIRPLVLNRKNALFAGHDQGAENWACIASLIETCKLNGVDPQAYLTDALTRLVNLWPASRIDELMPWSWVADNSADRLACNLPNRAAVSAKIKWSVSWALKTADLPPRQGAPRKALQLPTVSPVGSAGLFHES
jgi:hypothetical protein